MKMGAIAGAAGWWWLERLLLWVNGDTWLMYHFGRLIHHLCITTIL